jgi:hypothetical protein
MTPLIVLLLLLLLLLLLYPHLQLLLTGAMVVLGGWPTLKMAVTFLLATQQRIVGGAFKSGALKYQCLVPVKGK